MRRVILANGLRAETHDILAGIINYELKIVTYLS